MISFILGNRMTTLFFGTVERNLRWDLSICHHEGKFRFGTMWVFKMSLSTDLSWYIFIIQIWYLFFYFYFYFWLCWVFVSVRGLSPVAASGGHSSSRCAGLSLSQPLLLRGTGSRRAGSVVVAHGPSCPAACGIFPDQGSNPCPLHW